MATRIILATNNKGKLKELKRILEPLGFELVTPAELNETHAPEENGATFEENALIKARYFAEKLGMPALADDSGLCVDALGGEPGVRSARYAGEGATDAMNNRKLLENLRGVPPEKRTARFRCVAACVTPDGRSVTAEGSVEGAIIEDARGAAGFGYDPLFLEPKSGKTFGELYKDEKDAVSHRGMAFRKLASMLKTFLDQ